MKTESLPKKSKLKLLVCFLLPNLAICSAPALSGQGTDTVRELSPYVITADTLVEWNTQMTMSGGRTATSLLETPMSVAILPREFLRDIGATDSMSFLQYAASGTVAGVQHTDDFQMRGYRTDSPLVDGAAGPNGAKVPMYDIDRVEIVKGPAALVFGNFRNVAGVINYVTRRPTFKPEGDVSLTVGTFGLARVALNASGPLTEDARKRYRVTVGGKTYDGPPVHGWDRDLFLGGSFDWDITDKLLLRTDVVHSHSSNQSPSYALIDPTTDLLWEGFGRGFKIASDWEKHTTVYQRARTDLVYTLSSDFAVQAQFQIMETDISQSIVWSQGGGAGLRANEAPNFERIYGRVNNNYAAKRTSLLALLDATWTKDFGFFRNRINFGYQNNDTTNRALNYSVPLDDLIIADPIASRPPEPSPATKGQFMPNNWNRSRGINWSSYFQNTVYLLEDKLILAGGARYVSKRANPTTGKAEFVPNFGAVYRINPYFSVYGMYAESFNPRSGVNAFGTPLVNIIGDSKEAGVKFNAMNDRLFGGITYFDIIVDPVNRLVEGISATTGQLIVANAQVGQETNKGFEADIGYVHEFQNGSWLNLMTAYYADPRNAEGRPATSAPKTAYTYFSRVTFNEGSLNGFSIGGGFSYTGEQAGAGFPVIPSYTMFSGLLGYRVGPWQAQLNIDNLANNKGVLFGSQGRLYSFVHAERTAKLTLTRRF